MQSTEWQTTGIEVAIKDSHPEPGLRRQHGIIRNVLVRKSNSLAIQLSLWLILINFLTLSLRLVPVLSTC